MAEIKIEKKKPVWPWVLLVLLILVGVYIYWSYNDTTNERDQNEIVTDTIQEMNDDYNTIEDNTLEIDTTTQY